VHTPGGVCDRVDFHLHTQIQTHIHERSVFELIKMSVEEAAISDCPMKARPRKGKVLKAQNGGSKSLAESEFRKRKTNEGLNKLHTATLFLIWTSSYLLFFCFPSCLPAFFQTHFLFFLHVFSFFLFPWILVRASAWKATRSVGKWHLEFSDIVVKGKAETCISRIFSCPICVCLSPCLFFVCSFPHSVSLCRCRCEALSTRPSFLPSHRIHAQSEFALFLYT